MKKCIVTTTINSITPATKKFSTMQGWDLVVAGDIKTPHSEYKNNKNLIYLDPDNQEKLDKPLSDMLGWKCIQRRNMAFVYALKHKYDIIATVDDDNIPYDNWGVLYDKQTVKEYTNDNVFFDPLSVTNYKHLWHRGFPLQHVHEKNDNISFSMKPIHTCDVQANLWDGDPDVDAICRMIYKPDCKFDTKEWFTTDKLTVFNSQNTILKRDALKHYFMFDGVGRMDDIFGSYILQKKGFNVVFGPPTVYQDRNEHDLTIDLVKEYVGYENVRNINTSTDFIPMQSYNRYVEISSFL